MRADPQNDSRAVATRETAPWTKGACIFATWQCGAGFLLCPQCGNFYGGERGLRTHQQVKHAQHYGAAVEAVRGAKQQIIAYAPLRVAQWRDADEGGAPERTAGALRAGLSNVHLVRLVTASSTRSHVWL